MVETERMHFAGIEGALDLVRTLTLVADDPLLQEQARHAMDDMLIDRQKAWDALNHLEFRFKAKQVLHITDGIDAIIPDFDVQAEHASEELEALSMRLREADDIVSGAHAFLSEHSDSFSSSLKRKLRRTAELMLATACDTRNALDELRRKILAARSTNHDELYDDLEDEEREARLANLLMENPGGILSFTDEVMDQHDLRYGVPEMGETVDLSLEQSLNSLQYSYGNVGFRGVRVEPGEIVRSYKVYDSDADHTVTGVALLEQDSNGKVSNRSSRTLNDAEQTEVALKQAQMFLSNYMPGRGDAIMRGKNPEMASRVYAAILFLKDQHPELKNIKIKCWVKDCYGPNTGLRLWGSNEQDFIRFNLDKEVLEYHGELMAEQLHTLTSIKSEGWQFREDVMKQTCSQQAKLDVFDEHALRENQGLFMVR